MSDEASAGSAYQVLARKHRPQTFDSLIGQEAMVRVLGNAFATGRIAQAYILTGVRGVGKTTTARIIARGLNCVGPDGQGGPTIAPCGLCGPCRAIAEGRHVDVIEMDAASNTGVDSMREVIENVRYKPVSARYKVYIVDEAHMLSTSAFNALLKTLEEPPPHAKFMFATTEIRKMPATILSRCQRFDLRRVSPERMTAHLQEIAGREGASLEPEALALIARASEGSVRDALSILDQAIATAGGDVARAEDVRRMLGLADRARIYDLLDLVMKGEAAGALKELRDQYDWGADPAALMRDLAEAVHTLSTVKVGMDGPLDASLSPEAQARGRALAEGLQMRALTRAWQLLIKALEEVERAPSAIMAAEMAIIRLCWVADLPSPEEILRKLSDEPGAARGPSAPLSSPPSGGGPRAALAVAPRPTAPAPAVAAAAAPAFSPVPVDFAGVAALIEEKRDGLLRHSVERFMRVTDYAPGRISYIAAEGMAADTPTRLSQALAQWTGRPWLVERVAAPEAQTAPATIAEVKAAAQADLKARLAAHPAAAAILAAFPGAELIAARPPGAAPPEAPPVAAPEIPEEFESAGGIFDDEAPWGDE